MTAAYVALFVAFWLTVGLAWAFNAPMCWERNSPNLPTVQLIASSLEADKPQWARVKNGIYSVMECVELKAKVDFTYSASLKLADVSISLTDHERKLLTTAYERRKKAADDLATAAALHKFMEAVTAFVEREST